MKIRINTPPQGSAILVTLLTAFVVGMALASYLTMVAVQNQSTLRSLAWNSDVPSMEAGVEEALTALQYYGTTNLVAGGWNLSSADGFYHKIGGLGSGFSYDAGIKPPPAGGPDQPTIECIGYAPTPANLVTSYNSPYAMIVGGFIPTYTPDVPTTKRKVRVLAKRQTPFQFAMLAKGQIDMNGNNIATDSFDSQDPAYNTNGKYDASKSKDKGDVATNAGLVNSVNVGNADIRGHVSTGPHGSVSVGSNGSVGDRVWAGSHSGIEPGWVSDDANVDIPDVQPPFTSGYTTPGGGKYPPVTGPTYDYILGSGNYRLSSFGGNVLVIGNAALLVDSSFSMGSHDQITISSNASLKMYVAASSGKIAGNGVVNDSGDPMAFQYYGLPSNTSLSFSGNAAFTGVIYAPNAGFSLNGGGNNTYDFVGASVTKTVTMNGHFNFHYDESIPRRSTLGQYVVGSWNEINPNN